MRIPFSIRKDENVTASALFGVAAIQILIGAIGWLLYSGEMELLDRVIRFSGIIYIALGIAARWIRIPAAVAGTLLYMTFLAFQASSSMDLLMAGVIFKILVVILLVVAVGSALRRPPAPPREERV